MKNHLVTFIAILTVSVTAAAKSNAPRELGPDTLLLSADGDNSSPFIFNDAIKALDAISKSQSHKMTLFVEPGVYWLDDPDDPAIRYNPSGNNKTPFAAEIRCDTLSIIGLAEKAEDIVFAVNRGQTQGALGNYTMLHFFGKSLTVENMTFGNYCNVDLIYPLNPALNRTKRRDAIVQAQLGICENTDRMFARNCRFISRLNLCPLVGARRSLYENCYFECTDDALCGSAIYLDCNFTFYSSKPFYSTASTGAIFLNCDIHTLVNGTQYLTKMPGMVTMIDTRFTSDTPVTLRWTRDQSAIRCYQSNVTLNGKPAVIDADRPELSAEISKSSLLNAYKIPIKDSSIYNIPNLLGGDDDWDPLGMLPAIKDYEKKLSMQLIGLPVAMQINPSQTQLSAKNDTLQLTPSLRLWGDYSVDHSPTRLSWTAPTTLKLIKDGNTIKAISVNHFPREMSCEVSAKSPDGLVAATNINILPLLKDAPSFAKNPAISFAKNELRLDYRLSSDGIDDSRIVWYRSTRQDLSDSTAVRHGHGSSARIYPLTRSDLGYIISAVVCPKLDDTKQGDRHLGILTTPVTDKMVKSLPKNEKTLFTSFAEIPIRKGKAGRKGFWHFDSFKPADTNCHDWTADENSSWYYGRGTDAAIGIGLVQATRGARLFYTPMRDKCRNMRLSLVAEPSKGPGQGFGSATGQYMDIYIKFDPVSLTGYALRIERTPDYDKAVTFTLVRYHDGKVSPISESVASSCYRTPCTITLEINNDRLTALARTDAPEVSANNPAVKPYITLSATIEPATDSSFGIQHTGSVGASATLIRDLNIIWE